jgi:sugar/nucleoside kinase (ribokinase family)
MTDQDTNAVNQTIAKLKNTAECDLNMIVGLDGFVDEIIHVVDKRHNFDDYSRINYIKDFGNRIVNAAGLSTNIEFVVQQTKLGGNGTIFSNALLEYGANLTYIGALGLPDIHPVFKSLVDRAVAFYSLCNPGHTDAVEFKDGKLMLGKHSYLSQITWERFKEVVGGVEKIAALIKSCHLFGMENWTMIPRMSEIWEGIIKEVFPLLSNTAEKPIAFFDLADPEKRTKADILDAMMLISKFESKFRAILGLNEKELYEIANVFDIRDGSFESTANAVYSKMGIYCLVVHPVKEAACVIDGKYYRVEGPYCAAPKLTTGAGDNFNAGFCYAQCLGFDPLSSLLLGVGTSGYYVRNAASPSLNAIKDFLQSWRDGDI